MFHKELDRVSVSRKFKAFILNTAAIRAKPVITWAACFVESSANKSDEVKSSLLLVP